ncbi:MAG: glycosyltransferase family 4 protein [Planctomycetes bacterium]|nr:glycosyltransferase family 4 protein [Planctomycetota bacterium]
MKLTLLSATLGCGGAERVLSTLANHWVETGHSIHLITLTAVDSDFYEVDKRVRRIGLDLSGPSPTRLHAAFRNTVRLKRLKEAIVDSEPQAVISFIDRTNILALLAARRLKLPVIVSERTDPSQHRIGRVWETLRSMAYPRAAAIVVQTRTVFDEFAKRFPGTPIHIIPNPVQIPVFRSPGDRRTSDAPRRVIAIGRLTREKGMDLFLRAFGAASRENPEWTLTILGEGPERSGLERLISGLSLSGKVKLEGQVNSPLPYLRNSDIFVLPSRYEGFPNALLEAMACGLPVVSFDCPSGPREIIRDGEDGILVTGEDVPGLAKALSALMRDPSRRKRLGERAAEAVRRFDLPGISARWMKLLAKVTGS